MCKDFFHRLTVLKMFVSGQEQGLNERFGLLATRFPKGFEGQ
jgi:hypothetical protein